MDINKNFGKKIRIEIRKRTKQHRLKGIQIRCYPLSWTITLLSLFFRIQPFNFFLEMNLKTTFFQNFFVYASQNNLIPEFAKTKITRLDPVRGSKLFCRTTWARMMPKSHQYHLVSKHFSTNLFMIQVERIWI